ncbi:hypothetical protein BBI01_00140 [Chryseobacterium artocarpi]|uniref:Uncharacterized protein n=1 Tax=Chryseobacterium artocarpi TaxID=1414727 RepID=A0A1B8ZZ83_9FLAO|nr:hypothetical protein [Chryseobacterium artocarpi]OCA76911.1 hypothetical protein BBI01_00140 [Chryseobacterium artocarpi]
MAKGIKSIKQQQVIGTSVYLIVDQWHDGTTELDKSKKLTWLCFSQDKKKQLDTRQLESKDSYVIKIPPKLAGSYRYYVEASFSGKKDPLKDTGLYVYGTTTKKVVTSKWCAKPDGEDLRKSQFSYGHLIYLGLETEGMNGDQVTVEVYRRVPGGGGSKDDQYITAFTHVQVIDGEVNLKMGNTYQWYGKIKKPNPTEEFYVKVKDASGKYISDGKDRLHARYLRIKNNIVSRNSETPTNHTPTKVDKPEISFKRHEPCRYDKVIIGDKDSNKKPFNIVVYDPLQKKNITTYETLAKHEAGTTIDLTFEKITHKGCFTQPNHKKEIEIYINGQKQKTQVVSGDKYTLPIQARANTYLLRTNPSLFFVTPDAANTYRIVTKTCAQPNNPLTINVYPNIEREVTFVLTLFPSFGAEVNQKFSTREKLTDYNKKQSMQLIRNETEILYNAKGGLGFGLQAKVKVDNVESSIELAHTRNQIKKLIGFYHTVNEVLSVFDGRGKESTSLAYDRKVLPKVTFDIEPPNVALALRITNKKVERTLQVVPQFTGALALKPITKIKIGVDLLSLLQYMGVGGKIASWIKDTLEAKYKFTIYIIFEVSLEARAELSLTYNKVEGFAPGPRKLQIEAGVGIKGGVKSTEFVTIVVPEADGSPQKVKVEKWKGEASGASSMLYTYEVNADSKGQYSKHKLEFTGVKATIVVYSIKNGMKYNESFKKDFTIIEKPDKAWYESEKEYTV